MATSFHLSDTLTDEERSLGYELATIRKHDEWTGHVNAVILRLGASDRVIKIDDDGRVRYEIERFGVLDFGFDTGGEPEWLPISDEFDSPAAAKEATATCVRRHGLFEVIPDEPGAEY